MRFTELVIATTNKGKIKEIEKILKKFDIKVLRLSDFDVIFEPAETGKSFKENAILKAKYYFEKIGKPCLADDSGLEVDALNGAPGVFSARFAGNEKNTELNNKKLLKVMKNVPDNKRTARYRCVTVIVGDNSGKPLLITEGCCEGIILREGVGSAGFGYDPIFFVPELGKTMSQLTPEEKNKISHRGKALRKLFALLSNK